MWTFDLFHDAILALVSATLRTRPITVLAGLLEIFSRNSNCASCQPVFGWSTWLRLTPMPRDTPVMRYDGIVLIYMNGMEMKIVQEAVSIRLPEREAMMVKLWLMSC